MTDEHKARLMALGDYILAAPDPDEQPTPKLQERAGIERSNRQNRFNTFSTALATVDKWAPKEAVILADLADMRRCETHVVETITTLEATLIPPDADEKTRNRLRYDIDELREAHNALQAVRFGIEWLSSMEMIPPLALNFLATECGWRTRDGAFWRGSVSSLMDRLENVQLRLRPAHAAIGAEMARSLEEVSV